MRLFIITVFLIVSLVIGLEIAHGAEFTIDYPNSLKHAGISGGLGFSGGLFLKSQQKTNKLTDTQIVLTAGTLAFVPGAFKEGVMDAYIDWGDMLCNLSSYPGAWLGVKTGHYFFVTKQDDTVVVNYKVRF